MPRYWWWELTDLWPMLGEWIRLWLSGEAKYVRLRFYPKHPDYDDQPRLILWDTRSEAPCGSYNITRTCPPDCE